ncbi:MMPL family transporter [Antrihabitans sp. YC2-6]|uniref:MMPL family transporter n=1 Tax=Antrihabitans sp. YC2-6 TaxID=2799498 RepID=UPI0018F2B9F9|nr:MMPL family transporter [Antrihabitans sp. YC2-6]MBJ8344921.1 MMPL family transporter [Antrihabitans sp. YC2-6]
MADTTSTVRPRPPVEAAGTSLGYRWAQAIARLRRPLLALWAALLVACALAYPALNSRLEAPDFTADVAESTSVDRMIEEYFPQLGAEQNIVVFDSADRTFDSTEYRSLVSRTLDAVRTTDGVVSVQGPVDNRQISQDRRSAFAVVGLDGSVAERSATAADLAETLAAASTADIDVVVTGYSPIQNGIVDAETVDVERAETFGIPVALILLILALGAFVAAIVPISVAVAGILSCIGTLFLLTHFLPLPSLVVSIATMIGTGIGIDYAMFLVTRFREELAVRGVQHRSEEAEITAALGAALATTGKNIVASGLIVVISLCSLVIVEAPIFRAIAVGVGLAVVCTLIVGLTLLPALLATLGPAVNRGALPARLRPAHSEADHDGSAGMWARWAGVVMRRPVLFGFAATAALLLAAYPVTDLKYGLDMGLPALAGTPTGHGLDVLEEKFQAGLLSPVEIVVTGADEGPLSGQNTTDAMAFVSALQDLPDVVDAFPQTVDGRMMITAIPATSFDTTEASDLILDLRAAAAAVSADNGPEIYVGGATAEFIDISDEITSKFPWVVTLVLLSSLIFLIFIFRSLLLPLKAIAMNLLATGAAIGLTVAIFQWGWGSSALAFHSPGFLQVFLPTIVFAMLFGLSMDYEVFLIGRMKESWEGGDTADPNRNENAVCEGIDHTARPITAAAAIMVAVFGSFVTAEVLELKQIGLALAIAIAIDAIVIRLVLVPALMRLFGPWNWWFPGRRVRVAERPRTSPRS